MERSGDGTAFRRVLFLALGAVADCQSKPNVGDNDLRSSTFILPHLTAGIERLHSICAPERDAFSEALVSLSSPGLQLGRSSQDEAVDFVRQGVRDRLFGLAATQTVFEPGSRFRRANSSTRCARSTA